MVELLVAMGVFAILISLVTGVFVRSLRTQRATVALIAAASNAELSIEQIMREIRLGQGFPESNTYSALTFTNAKGQLVTYSWNNNLGVLAIERSVDGGTPSRITAENVKVTDLKFEVFKGTPADRYPTFVTIALQVGTEDRILADATISLQTSISSRVLE